MVLSYNRITHYPSLAQHPIPSSPFTRQPSDSPMFVYILVFLTKITQMPRYTPRSKDIVMAEPCVSYSQRKFPLDSSGFTVLLADAVEFTCCHADDETTPGNTVPVPLSTAPQSMLAAAYITFISIVGYAHTFNLWLYSYLFTQSSYELHSGILNATYAALYSYGVLSSNNLRVCPRVASVVPKRSSPFSSLSKRQGVFPAVINLRATFVTVYTSNDFP